MDGAVLKLAAQRQRPIQALCITFLIGQNRSGLLPPSVAWGCVSESFHTQDGSIELPTLTPGARHGEASSLAGGVDLQSALKNVASRVSSERV